MSNTAHLRSAAMPRHILKLIVGLKWGICLTGLSGSVSILSMKSHVLSVVESSARAAVVVLALLAIADQT